MSRDVAQAPVLPALTSRELRSRFAKPFVFLFQRGADFPRQLLHGFGERRRGRVIFPSPVELSLHKALPVLHLVVYPSASATMRSNSSGNTNLSHTSNRVSAGSFA